MYGRVFLAIFASMMFLLPGLAQATLGGEVQDVTITTRIETIYLMNEHLNPLNINTTTQDGVVTLTGSVSDEVQRDLAEELAAGVKGVRRIVNRLTVVGETVSGEPDRTWRQRVHDATTSATIRSRLLYHKQFRGLKINVKTVNGVVTLSGVVPTDAEKEIIGQVAADTRDVEKVNNNLTVRAKKTEETLGDFGRDMSDEVVEKHVETALLLNRHISIRGLQVEINDGVCILTGTVDSQTQKDLAESIALSIYGVKQVQNDILVTDPSMFPALGANETPAPIEDTNVAPNTTTDDLLRKELEAEQQ